MRFSLLPCILLLQMLDPSWARRSLSASSLVTCMENSQISPSYFEVTFDPDDRALRYTLDLTTELSTYIIAHIQVYAYGFMIIEREIDVCSLEWRQLCPVYPGSMQVESVQYISQNEVNMIPNIAYNVPDIDAVVKAEIRDRDSGEILSCLQVSFTNGKTIAQTGAKWATAVIAGAGLLIAAILSAFGNSNAASHISANAVSLFLYFQSVVVVSMQHVERVPPIASSWAENLAWSMGFIRVPFMQDIFRWYIQSTGGTPTLYFKETTQQILVQRALDYLSSVHELAKRGRGILGLGKRALDYSLSSNTNLVVLRGIQRMGYNSHIEPTSIVATGFTFSILCGFLLVVIIVLIKQVFVLLMRSNKINPETFNRFKITSMVVKGSLLRYLYIGFTQLLILSLWEFTVHDSAAMVVLAVLFLLQVGTLIGYSLWRTLKFGKESIAKYSNPAALLYGDSRILNKYGFCYTMFHAEKYWFSAVLVGYTTIKAIFIALCQGSGKTSAVVLFVLDLAYTIYLIIQGPYLNKPTNIVNYMMSIVTTLNSFMFMFFSDLFGQPAQVSSIMGWVFFILNAAFSLILLLMIIGLITMSIVSKNPDARFAPAKDDRTSFQRLTSVKRKINTKNNTATNELLALGIAAQDHSTDWEGQMYKLNETSNPSGNEVRSSDILTPKLDSSGEFGEKNEYNNTNSSSSFDDKIPETTNLGTKLKDKLSRGLSLKSRSKDANKDHTNVNRVSDTLKKNDSSIPRDDSLAHLKEHNRGYSTSSVGKLSNSENAPTNTTGIL